MQTTASNAAVQFQLTKSTETTDVIREFSIQTEKWMKTASRNDDVNTYNTVHRPHQKSNSK